MERSLQEAIDVDCIGSDHFVDHGLTRFMEGRSAFGGHLVAQALSSAVKTIEDPKFLLQSVHCHYIRPVNSDSEVIYHVARLKDGRSISTRGVRATQVDKTVFSCLVSLSAEEKEDIGLTHTDRVMPQVHPIPNGETEGAAVELRSGIMFAHFPVKAFCSVSTSSTVNEARMFTWFKTKHPISVALQNTQRVALSYATDFFMPFPIFMKYPKRFQEVYTTSLDHSIWFHENVDFNQWHLFAKECLQSSHGLPLNMSRIYDQAGTLVATAMQQSLVKARL